MHRSGAQTVADFYRGKSLTITVGLSAGGGYDLHARVLAKYFGRHIPGAPAIVVKNSPGAGGLALVNALAATVSRDGTELATFDRGIALDPLLGGSQARFDPLKLGWIGSTDNDASTCLSWHTAAVKTMDDVLRRELIVGGTGATAGYATTRSTFSCSSPCRRAPIIRRCRSRSTSPGPTPIARRSR